MRRTWLFTLLTSTFVCLHSMATEPLDSLYQCYISSPMTAAQTNELLQLLYDAEYADSTDLTPDHSIRERQLAVHLAMSYLLYDSGDLHESLDAVVRAEEVATQIRDTVMLNDDLASHHGVCLFRLGRFGEAIEQFNKCVTLGMNRQDASMLSSAYSNIAAVFLAASTPENKLYEEAHTYILEAIEHEKQVPGSPTLSIRYGVASEINIKRQELDEAYAMAYKAFVLDSLSGDPLKMARRQSQMGDVLFAMKQMPEAEQQYLTSLHTTEAMGERFSTVITCKQLADLYVEMGQKDKAESYYAKGLAIAEETGNKPQQQQLTQKLYELFKGHDDKQALQWLEHSTMLKDSIWNEHLEELLSDYQIKHETIEKNNVIEKQKHEIRKRNIALAIALLVLVAMAINILFIKIIHRERKDRIKAEEQVEMLEKSMNERNVKLINDLTDYILLHMDEKAITNEEICKHLCVSNTNLNQQVNRMKGCSIQGYVQQLRMEKAERLLRTSEKTVSEIAMQCGYEDISYFSRVFKQRYGVAPTKYRQDAKG